jgi:hypothetical protein
MSSADLHFSLVSASSKAANDGPKVLMAFYRRHKNEMGAVPMDARPISFISTPTDAHIAAGLPGSLPLFPTFSFPIAEIVIFLEIFCFVRITNSCCHPTSFPRLSRSRSKRMTDNEGSVQRRTAWGVKMGRRRPQVALRVATPETAVRPLHLQGHRFKDRDVVTV